MLSKELIQQIRKNGSEDNRLEIKKALGGCPKIYDTLSSFSNQSGGGIIIFGIDQDAVKSGMLLNPLTKALQT